MKNTFKKSLRGEMLLLTVLPLALLVVLVIGVSVRAFYSSMTKQVASEMEDQCQLVETIYDRLYPGEFGIQMNSDGTYRVLKGTQDITDTQELLGEFKEIHGMEISIFCKGVRVLTTISDEQGAPLSSTKISPVVENDIEASMQGQFYQSVTIGAERYFAYYKPIILSDGTLYGMIGICRPIQEARDYVYRAVLPIILVYFIITVIIGFISASYSGKIVGSIEELQRFMRAVSNADFSVDIGEKLLKKEDELGALAQIGRRMQEALRQLVEYDTLTQLHNRRSGDAYLSQVHETAQEEHGQYCIAIGDIDFFKKVNDTYGHEAGDEVLKTVARILKKNMVSHGMAVRWGGEEFLLIFDHDDFKAAHQLLEQIRQELEGEILLYRDKTIQVTMSLGLIQASGSEDIDNNLRMVDDLLYEAKSSGRNQICWKEQEIRGKMKCL